MSKITAIEFNNASEQEQKALNSYSAAVAMITSQSGFEVTPEIQFCENDESKSRFAVVSIPLERFTLRLVINPQRMSPRSKEEIAELFCQRISEALAHQDRFTDRLDSVRARVQASLSRGGGGMRMLSLAMDELPITEPFHWNDQQLELKVEMLDRMLRSEIVVLHEWSSRKFAGTIRWMAAEQRQRAARRHRLSAHGAVLEVDAIVEHLLAERGITVALMTNELSTGIGHKVLESKDSGDGGKRMTVALRNGRLEAWGFLSEQYPSVYLLGSAALIDYFIPEHQRASLVGRPLADLVDHPALASVRVTSAKDRERRMTDLTLRVRRRFVTEQELLAA